MEYVNCIICGSSNSKKLVSFRPDKYRKLLPSTAKEEVRFLVCKECGLVYQNPRFDIKELKEIYSDRYRIEVGHYSDVPTDQYLDFSLKKSETEVAWLEKHMNLNSGGNKRKVLEIGCATGQLLRLLSDRNWEPFGIEPTKSFAEFGRSKYQLNIISDMFENICLEEKFDLIIMSNVLEHILSPESLLSNVVQLLRGRGNIYIQIPYYKTYLKLRASSELFVSPHLYVFSKTSLTNLANKCGVKIKVIDVHDRYMQALLEKSTGAMVSKNLCFDDPINVYWNIFFLRLKYFFKRHWRYLLAEWTKRQIILVFGSHRGQQIIKLIRSMKRKLLMASPNSS